MDLSKDLPVDHRLANVYRYGAGLSGLALLCFGALGFANQLSFFGTSGTSIAGLSSNGALSLISVVFGLLLAAGAVAGGNLASVINMVVGALFILSGFANLALLRTSANILGFRMPNVLFSFAMGLVILTFGMYGRVSGGLPADNPYWRRKHPEAARRLAALGSASPRPSSAAFTGQSPVSGDLPERSS
ncbi:DUF4383 domain-containing protein [Streptacidiphilus sp. P02-A3a]|uniref:DUF4383 domain-containing protein n=1 Tax=Streptacidiphilus sp. P02-A3a TaxID=2704468 RepID=UPI0015F7D512|nr:DUF4383 domain-containing protein [Streptacidiphilus sp. P02-A3a]QMU69974.1 DUF4383 domain-containing protein [Streptacidiphilus sp. P02-A3a]